MHHFPLGGVESATKRRISGFVRILGLRAEKIGRGRFMFLRSGGCSRSETPHGCAPFVRRE
jgi:hypothetical protein